MEQEQMLMNRVKKYGILIRIQMDRTITNNAHSENVWTRAPTQNILF